jgi:hypothetical protein
MKAPHALPSIEALIDFAGGGESATPLTGVGYSNAALSRVSSFVLKRTRLDRDWTARRTADRRGREALLVSEPALAAVWEVFACPYVAYAFGDGEVGLLMNDLTDSLLPDERAPLTAEQEAAILQRLAGLHGRFWGARAPQAGWLSDVEHLVDMLPPSVAGDDAELAMLPPGLRENVPRGWTAALPRVPAEARTWLTCSGSACAREWQDLPRTLVHGDVKVANFAILADGGVAAFDWAMAGVGPCSIDLGWYVAVNASRLTAPKEEIIRRYRLLLEAELGRALPDSVWQRLEHAAAVCGARTLLWSKALALESGRDGAEEEWAWWIDRLGRQTLGG